MIINNKYLQEREKILKYLVIEMELTDHAIHHPGEDFSFQSTEISFALSGLLRMCVPEVYGGPEIDPVTMVEAIAAIGDAAFRRGVGLVPQEPFLFAGSIRDNLLVGRRDVGDHDLEAVCIQVGLGRLLDRLPDRLDTPCHERGVSLSALPRCPVVLFLATAPPLLLVGFGQLMCY